jgi:hypothetical protein
MPIETKKDQREQFVQTQERVASKQVKKSNIEQMRIDGLLGVLNTETISIKELTPTVMIQVMAILALPSSPAKTIRVIKGLESEAIDVMMDNLAKTKITKLVLEELSPESVNHITARLAASKITAIKSNKLSTAANLELRLGLQAAGFKENENGEFIKLPTAASTPTKSTGSITTLLTSRFSIHSKKESQEHDSKRILRKVKSSEEGEKQPLLSDERNEVSTRTNSH